MMYQRSIGVLAGGKYEGRQRRGLMNVMKKQAEAKKQLEVEAKMEAAAAAASNPKTNRFIRRLQGTSPLQVEF